MWSAFGLKKVSNFDIFKATSGSPLSCLNQLFGQNSGKNKSFYIEKSRIIQKSFLKRPSLQNTYKKTGLGNFALS
jgi:hypothetical protein